MLCVGEDKTYSHFDLQLNDFDYKVSLQFTS